MHRLKGTGLETGLEQTSAGPLHRPTLGLAYISETMSLKK